MDCGATSGVIEFRRLSSLSITRQVQAGADELQHTTIHLLLIAPTIPLFKVARRPFMIYMTCLSVEKVRGLHRLIKSPSCWALHN